MLPEDRFRHLAIIGKSGVGKSTLLSSLIRQDIAAGRGFAVLDPHGDLVNAVLPHVPDKRQRDVLLIDPSDRDYPIAFNVFRQGRERLAPDVAASSLVSVFKKEWKDSWGPRLEYLLRNAILAVAEREDATLLLLHRFLTDAKLRDSTVAKLHDPVVRTFWAGEFASWGARLQAEALSPVLNKLGAFIAHPVSRPIVSSKRSRIDFAEFMNDEGIVLCNLTTGAIGEDVSHLLGSLILSSMLLSAAARPRGGPGFIIYIDEFQRFVTESLDTMLSEARKYGLGLVLAHQYLSQLPENIRDAVTGNVGSRIVMRIGADDARMLEPEFFPPFTAKDLQNLGSRQMAVRLLAGGRELDPFTAMTLDDVPRPFDAEKTVQAIQAHSRARYATPLRQVEDAITQVIGK
jgi:hypothetical protein